MEQTKIIYTAIFGDYDELYEPEFITPNVRYICFTDKPLQSKVWEIYHVNAKYDSVRQARHCKIMFHEYIKDFTLAMWIDANQQLKEDVTTLFIRLEKSYDMILLKHPDRICIYEEAKECIRLNKDYSNIIKAQMNCYENGGYPKNNGLVATGLMLRKNKVNVNALCKIWFDEVLLKSRRDQLSFNWCYHIFNNNIQPKYACLPFEILYEIATRWKHKK